MHTLIQREETVAARGGGQSDLGQGHHKWIGDAGVWTD